MMRRHKTEHPLVLTGLLLALAGVLTITEFLEPLNWLAYARI